MNIEFTQKLATDSWADIRLAVDQRMDNLNEANLSGGQKAVLEKIMNSPYTVMRQEEYQMLHEMAAYTRKLWANASALPVYFFGGFDERAQRVLNYASEWSQHCSIRFVQTDNIKEGKIRVAFNIPSSWSYIGTDALGVAAHEPTMNFGWLTDSLPERDYRRVVLHEFGHALGLIHEHQSPAVKLDWNKQYIYHYFFTHHQWTQSDVDNNIFQEFETTHIRASAVDKHSIMAYFIPPIFTLNNIAFDQNYTLSEMDKKYIGKLYPQVLYS